MLRGLDDPYEADAAYGGGLLCIGVDKVRKEGKNVRDANAAGDEEERAVAG